MILRCVFLFYYHFCQKYEEYKPINLNKETLKSERSNMTLKMITRFSLNLLNITHSLLIFLLSFIFLIHYNLFFLLESLPRNTFFFLILYSFSPSPKTSFFCLYFHLLQNLSIFIIKHLHWLLLCLKTCDR